MTTEPVTVHDGYYTITTPRWLAQRTGAHLTDLTSQLDEFTRCELFDDYRPQLGIAPRMQLFCAARGWPLADGCHIAHDDTVLTYPIDIVLTADGRHSLALVSICGGTAQVYADITTDAGYWLDAKTVEIACPKGHRWSWDGDPRPQWYLDRVDGLAPVPTTLHTMYGGRPDAPFERCRECLAFDHGRTPTACPCPGTAIYCPICQLRCQLALPEVPTISLSEDR